MDLATALWRRLDAPGHDACRLLRSPSGWRLEGTAVFRQGRSGACLRYEIAVDRSWRTREGRVTGWTGRRAVDVTVTRSGSRWALDGDVVPGLSDCVDLDLGFTPATNALQLRRLGLAVGARATCPVAWWDAGRSSLRRLPQSYERRSAFRYRYESPTVPYRAVLEVLPTGFVARYPGLWRVESGE